MKRKDQVKKELGKQQTSPAAKLNGINWQRMSAFGEGQEYKKAVGKNQQETKSGENNRTTWDRKGHRKGSIGTAASIEATLKEKAEKHAID